MLATMTAMTRDRKRSATAPESATGVMEEHHLLLEELLASVREAAENESFAEARQSLAWFRIELDKHMRVEEQLMFPLFEVITGLSDGPTHVRRAEHRQINALLDRIALALAEDVGIDEETARLTAMLDAHDFEEQQMLRPVNERMVAEDAQAALLEGAGRLLAAPLPG